jgi:hypothetical protein
MTKWQGDDEEKIWIPAFAGMTNPQTHPHPTLPLKGRAKDESTKNHSSKK